MIDGIGTLLQVLLASFGLAAGIETGSLAACAVVMAAALIVLVLNANAPRRFAHASLARPRRQVDVSAVLSQNDPDAAGHPRSRAPGVAASAA